MKNTQTLIRLAVASHPFDEHLIIMLVAAVVVGILLDWGYWR